MSQNHDSDLRYGAANAAQFDTHVCVTNILQSLFSECTVTANGKKVTNSKVVPAHIAFIVTEHSKRREAKDTWLKYQA